MIAYGKQNHFSRLAQSKLEDSVKNRTWMMGIKRIEKIRNEEIRASAGVANIRGNKRSDTDMVRTCGQKYGRCSNENMEVGGRRKMELRWE